jgi:hypothetical protein
MVDGGWSSLLIAQSRLPHTNTVAMQKSSPRNGFVFLWCDVAVLE